MALADVTNFMIRATYADSMEESRYDGRFFGQCSAHSCTTEWMKRVFPLMAHSFVNCVFFVLNSISDIKMDIAVSRSTGNERALEVEQCACPQGYRGPSCQVHI